MYCSKCGNEIDNEAMICPKCGCATTNMQVQKNDSPAETNTIANSAIILALVMPIVGLILGIIGCCKYKDEDLKKKSITAIIISIVVWVICMIILSL